MTKTYDRHIITKPLAVVACIIKTEIRSKVMADTTTTTTTIVAEIMLMIGGMGSLIEAAVIGTKIERSVVPTISIEGYITCCHHSCCFRLRP